MRRCKILRVRCLLVATYLDEIMAWHRERAAADPRSLAGMLGKADRVAPRPSFRAALMGLGCGVIAEIKRRSPSKGALTQTEVVPAELATEYAAGGAVAVSVLTDSRFFGGSLADLGAVARAVDLPLLRKDFVVSPRDLIDAKVSGASAALLIAGALSDAELASLLSAAVEVGIETLVEVHGSDEFERFDVQMASAVGVNQRDLVTFAVDRDRAVAVRSTIPDGVPAVAESGVEGAEDVAALAEAGFSAVLVGEVLMRAPSRREKVIELVEAGRGVRQGLRHNQSG